MKIGIDIGGSHIAVALVSEKGEIVSKLEEDLVKKENIEKYIVDFVDSAIEKLNKNGDVTEMGIAAPGNPKGTVIKNIVNLKIDCINFETIEEKYNIKIKSINDGKAAALTEKKYGAMNGYKDCAFLCLGTGIGAAIFLNNRLLQSSRNPGFEIGHMIIQKNGNICNCGKRGCFETYCSMKRFKNKINDVLNKIDDNNIDIENSKLSEGALFKELLKKNIQNGEIQKIIDEYIDDLVIGLSNVIDIFEPEVICLGGSFVHFKDILYDRLIEKMNEKMYVFNKQSIPKIVLAKLQNDAGIIGATLIP